MPTPSKQIDDYTENTIVEKIVHAMKPLGVVGTQKILDNMTKISAHLPPGLNSLSDLRWELITEDEQKKLKKFIDATCPAFDIYSKLPAPRQSHLNDLIRQRLYGGR